MKVGEKTFKVHLDGYNITDTLAGKAPNPRHEFLLKTATVKTTRRQNLLAAGRRFHCLAATKLGLCLASAAMIAGCAHLGPRTIPVDRFDYSPALADSWKQQTPLSIVKLRYMDLRVFVDVASVVAGYSMQTGVSVNGTLSSKTAVLGNYLWRRAGRPSTPTGPPSPMCR